MRAGEGGELDELAQAHHRADGSTRRGVGGDLVEGEQADLEGAGSCSYRRSDAREGGAEPLLQFAEGGGAEIRGRPELAPRSSRRRWG
jgi:hypothetical protein